MADPIGGQGISDTATGGGLPVGQTPNPAPDVAGGLGGGGSLAQGPSLSTYYQGGRGKEAAIDQSGRGFFGTPGQQGETAGLVGAPSPAPADGAPVPGAVPPPTGLAPSGTTPPGAGQESAAAGAQSLAQGTGQTGSAPLAPTAGVLGPNGSWGPPQGATQIGTQNGAPVYRGLDGQSMFTVDPATGALTPFTGDPNNQGGGSANVPGVAGSALGGSTLAQGTGPIAPAPVAPAPAPVSAPAPAPAPTSGAPGPGMVFINGQWVSTGGTAPVDSGGSGAAGGAACFTGDVPVLMADGGRRSIEKIMAGDRVRVMDWDTLEETDHEVTSTSRTEPGQSSDTALYTINGIRVTGMHRFATGHQAWKRAKDLEVGDLVLGPSGRRVIKTVEVGPITEAVYNLRVGTEERTANFYVVDPATRAGPSVLNSLMEKRASRRSTAAPAGRSTSRPARLSRRRTTRPQRASRSTNPTVL